MQVQPKWMKESMEQEAWKIPPQFRTLHHAPYPFPSTPDYKFGGTQGFPSEDPPQNWGNSSGIYPYFLIPPSPTKPKIGKRLVLLLVAGIVLGLGFFN